MSVLVTGGAGYIGSACVELLHGRGMECVVLDNLTKGHRTAVPKDVPFIMGDIHDGQLLASVFADHGVTAIMHFAALSEVGESMKNPGAYYDNNVVGTMTLLNAMRMAKVGQFIFSSTAAVYGDPVETPITETHPTAPANAYGSTKLAVEHMLRWYQAAHGIRYVSLRYFNAAGATRERGEDHTPESHLIPLVIDAALGRRPEIAIFGTDYPTPDGTCIRDYIHILDLAEAHLLALQALRDGYEGNVFNLGNGAGYSVREVIRTVEAVANRPVPAREAERRAGDPARLVASAAKITQELGWKPQRSALSDIVESAWQWRQSHPKGYGD